MRFQYNHVLHLLASLLQSLEYVYRVYTVRESQGEKGLFGFGQGKSGKLAVVRGKIVFSFCRSGESFIFHYQRNMYNTLITR